MIGYIAVIGAAFLVTFALTPVMIRLSWRFGVVDRPDARRVHTRPTPRLGGAAIVAGFLVGFGVAGLTGEFRPVFRTIAPPLGVVLSTLTMYLVGQLDDLRDVSAPAKTAGSVLSGSILAVSGVAILFFRVPFVGLVALPPDLVPLITVLWVVGMAQAVNLIDGLDGLAAGVVGIASGAVLMFAEHLDNAGSIISDDNIGAVVAACVVGACLGFLPWNFHPAKTFMGDAGALTLGLWMATATIAIGGNTDAEVQGQTFFFFAPLFLPLVILGVPIVDTAWSLLRRARSRSGLTIADKNHLHHRLIRLGHGQRRAVLILWGWTAVLSGAVLVPVYTGSAWSVVPLVVPVIGLCLFTWYAPAWQDRRRAERAAAMAGPPGDERLPAGAAPRGDS
ncbi:MAG TPA: MraY family glycosyltransferase [Acidimicrobiales bacterium]|nr:MraY family glycosyltransferase [Acidimicrobiales bacterium]